MLEYTIRRLLIAVPTLLGITFIVFIAIWNAPGDPAAIMTDGMQNPEASDKMMQQFRKQFRLDEPFHKAYLLWLGDLLQGDFGTSYKDFRPVSQKVVAAIPPTLKVNITALIISFFLSLPIGIYAAAKQNGWFDRIGGVILYILYSLPSYVGAIILIVYLSVRWELLPMGGMRDENFDLMGPWDQFVDMVAHMTLYLTCSIYSSLAYYSRFIRQNMLEVIRQDYIRTARAKGLSERVVILKHAFRNTLIPFITMLGLVVPFLLGGSVILERIFEWPGMGQLFISAIYERDRPVIMALTVVTASLVLMANLVVDLFYGVVDPRVSHR